MISESLKKVAADSNVILSATIGKRALQVFTQPDIEFITTQFNLEEVEEYLPRLASKYALDVRWLVWQLKMLPLASFPERHYKSHVPKAQKLWETRDPDDIHLAALALKENVPLWSNDRDFEKLSIPVYTTVEFLKMLHK